MSSDELESAMEGGGEGRSDEFNRILLSHFPIEGAFQGHTDSTGTPRPSLVGMILEEFVSLSAAEIVVDEGVRADMEEQAPPQLFKRLRFIDRSSSDRKHATFFAPLAEEFAVAVRPGSTIQAADHLSDQVQFSLKVLHLLLPDFFVGIDHKVQIGVRPAYLRAAAALLRRNSRSGENRARLAALEGVLGLYGDEKAPSLQPRDLRAATIVGAFSQLLEDDLYRALTREAYALGISTRVASALRSMRSSAAQLLQKSPVRQLFNLGSRAVTVATAMPLPDSGEAAALLGSAPYLPPYADIHGAVKRAHKSWVSIRDSGDGSPDDSGE